MTQLNLGPKRSVVHDKRSEAILDTLLPSHYRQGEGSVRAKELPWSPTHVAAPFRMSLPATLHR